MSLRRCSILGSSLLILAAIFLTSCGDDKPTQPARPITVTDIDGNVYKTVTIGAQVWMAENLKVTRYRYGDAIPNVTGDNAWNDRTTGAYCDYNNDINNGATYGRLYNWYAVSDSRNIAPAGWHIPSAAEWWKLIVYLGGEYVAGGKMKEIGTTHWTYPNEGATNESGFFALPGGYRSFDSYVDVARFSRMGDVAGFWSLTETYGGDALARYLGYDGTGVVLFDIGKQNGLSVRCVKD